MVMPFGLNNADATNQRAIIAIFHDMIHDIVEDYVDDLVVKSRKTINHVTHLKRVFNQCQYLKMNSKKCAFVISIEKFLGVIAHHEGISDDEAKAIVVRKMPSPTTQDQLQSLTEKISYLG